MSDLIEHLRWDSDFFGVEVGRVDVAAADESRLAAIEDEARARAIDCVYASLDATTASPELVATVQLHGYRLVEAATLMHSRTGTFERGPTPSTVRIGSMDDLPLLEDSIHVIGPWSRIGADPRFGVGAARRMFRAWVERAATDPARMLSIAEDEDGVTGLSTHVRAAAASTPSDLIDLMGVVKPGTGASDAMMAFFREWAETDDVYAGPCAARNLAVLRLLERCGYSARRCEYVFHRWFDESWRTP